jgi:DNA-binding XRE family transcriptional regulator
MRNLQIKAARDRLGLTMEAAAKRVGTSAPQINRLEKGQRDLTWDWIMRLSRAYECDPCDLMFGPGGPTVPIAGIIGVHGAVAVVANGRRVSCPRGLNPETTAALQVAADATLAVPAAGWYAFYGTAGGAPADDRRTLCLIRLADGQNVVRNVIRKIAPDRYLVAEPGSTGIEETAAEWISVVRALAAPEVAELPPPASTPSPKPLAIVPPRRRRA